MQRKTGLYLQRVYFKETVMDFYGILCSGYLPYAVLTQAPLPSPSSATDSPTVPALRERQGTSQVRAFNKQPPCCLCVCSWTLSSRFGVITLSVLGSAAAALSRTLSGCMQQGRDRGQHEGKDGGNWPAESSGAYGPYYALRPYFSLVTKRY